MEEHDSISSEMYRKLVTERDDLLGIIAYAIYKQRKNEFIRQELQQKKDTKRRGTDWLTEKEMKPFHLKIQDEAYVDALIQKAEKKRLKYLEIAFQEQIERHTNEVSKLEERIQSLEQECKKWEDLNVQVENAIHSALEKKPGKWKWLKDFGYESLVSFGAEINIKSAARTMRIIAPPNETSDS